MDDKRICEHMIKTSFSDFISNLHKLIVALANKNTNDSNIQTLLTIYNCFVKDSPFSIIENVLPYLWAYKDDLLNNNIENLRNKNFDKEIDDYYNKNHDNHFTKKDAKIIINTVVKTWDNLNNAEKIVLRNLTLKILQNGVTYVKAKKELLKYEELVRSIRK